MKLKASFASAEVSAGAVAKADQILNQLEMAQTGSTQGVSVINVNDTNIDANLKKLAY